MTAKPSRGDLIRNIIFVLVVPGVVGGLVPWLITRYEGHDVPTIVAVIAWVFLVEGVAVLLYGVWHFAAEGKGTPAPVAPTKRLVISGPYFYVRNPMYLAVGAVILGQALLFPSAAIFIYLLGYAVSGVRVRQALRRADVAAHVRRRIHRVPRDSARLVPAPAAVVTKS